LVESEVKVDRRRQPPLPDGLAAAVVVLWCLLAPLDASAEPCTGKTVGISDGDTISVLRKDKAVKVRL